MISRLSCLRSAVFVLAGFALLRPSESAGQISPAQRFPSESEQYTLQLINQARSSANGLTILQRLVTNNVFDSSIVASSTGVGGSSGTPWRTDFWRSNIPEVASNMNSFQVHPGDLKKQFQDLVIPNTPLVWHPNLGNVASGYNQIVIANAGAGPGFPHQLAPYQDASSFAAYAKRYTDGGYLPLNDISGLAENVASNFPQNSLMRFASFMIDWGPGANGIQSQTGSSHRKTIMSTALTEIGISSRVGWGANRATETQEFGSRFSRHVNLTGVIFRDNDRNGFYTPSNGEPFAGAVVVATASNGTSFRGTSYGSGGYVVEVNTPGTYSVGVYARFGFISLGSIAISNANVLRDVSIPFGTLATDFSDDYRPDILFENVTTHATEVRFLDGSTQTGSTPGLSIPGGSTLIGVADLSRNSFADYVLLNGSTRQMEVRYAVRGAQTGVGAGPTLPAGETLAAIADFNRDGNQDFLTLNTSARTSTIHFLNVSSVTGTAPGPPIPAGFLVTGAIDFDRDGISDLVLFNPSTNACQVLYLNSTSGVRTTGTGPAIPAGWTLAGPMYISNDSKPDLLLFNKGSGATAFWLLDGLTYLSSTRGPIAPPGWTLAAPRAQ